MGNATLVGFTNQASKDANVASGRFTATQANAVPIGSTQPPAYNAKTGATTGEPSPEYNSYLESLNKGTSVTTPNTSQPNPATVNATPYTIKGGDTLSGIAQAQGTSVADLMKNNPTIKNPNEIQAGAALNLGQQTPTQKGYNNAIASGTPAPQTGSATANTQQYAPQTQQDNSMVQTALANDKGYQQLLQEQAQWQQSQNQQETLVKQYQDLENQYQIPQMNAQLINMQNVINGTEDDIRNEVTAAGGMATNSQVLALTDSRNKTLLQNYNNLLATKNNADQQVNTMIGLAKEDQANARDNINEQLNIDSQISNYADKFTSNAQEGFKTVISAVGVSGLYNGLMNSDPTGGALNYASQVMGLTPQEMQQAAQQEEQQNAQKQQGQNLDIQSKQLDIKGKEITDQTAAIDLQNKQNPVNTFAAPGEADKSKVLSAIPKQDATTQKSIDMKLLTTSSTYFYRVKAQLGL